jgi:thiol-activated cytolysin
MREPRAGRHQTATRSDAAEIDRYIRALQYDPRQLLSVLPDGSTSAVPVGPETRDRQAGGGAVIICTKRQHSLGKNLDEVVILNPAAGAIFPGALVRADESLAEGTPRRSRCRGRR